MLDITKPENLALLFEVDGTITEDDSSDTLCESEEQEDR